MKSAHRHELETNALAHRLEHYIAQVRPYASTILGTIAAIIALMFIWTYWSGASAAKHSGSWDAYHEAIGAMPPDLDQLHRTAEEYPGTQMQQLADLTWADGQVWVAAQNYIYGRPKVNEILTRALSAYQSIAQSSDDKRLVNRAQLGIARVYELQNDLEKARQQYLLVEGGYADYAKRQAERLDNPDTKETYAWLATAKPPLPKAPMGPGTPGQAPPFSAGDLPLKGAGTNAPPTTQPGVDTSFQDFLKNVPQGPAGTADRYPTDLPAEGATDSATTPADPPADAPNTEAPPVESATPPAESAAPPAPAAESPTTETPSK